MIRAWTEMVKGNRREVEKGGSGHNGEIRCTTSNSTHYCMNLSQRMDRREKNCQGKGTFNDHQAKIT